MKTISVHFEEIRNIGWSEFIRKINRFCTEHKLVTTSIPIFFSLLISIVWALPLIILIRGLSPWVLIRIGSILSNRIGHFAFDGAEQLARLNKQPVNTVDLFWIEEPSCNEQLAKMIKRNLPVYSWAKYLDHWNLILPGGVIHHRPSSLTGSRDKEGLFQTTSQKLEFLPDEIETAKNWLRQQGWKDKEPFVCLLVRDSAYLSNDPLHSGPAGPGHIYHNFRDSDIDTYITAANWLADQGVWVLRMGKIMKEPISITHKRIIDYAFQSEKNDLLDIWLFANCSLCITTGSGPDTICESFNKPILDINFMPLLNNRTYSDAVNVPKNLYWENSGVPLNCREYLEYSYQQSKHYEVRGIKIVDLDSTMILKTVQETWQRLQGTWKETDNDLKKYNKFMKILKNHPDYDELHGYLHPKARLGAVWLRSKGKEFFEN
jgi:putative glycosyltransferase (TIGR04372 family)